MSSISTNNTRSPISSSGAYARVHIAGSTVGSLHLWNSGIINAYKRLPMPPSTSRRISHNVPSGICFASQHSSVASAPETMQERVVSKDTLFDVPVSNNGGRVRFLLYKKNLDIDIRPPTEIGGLRSPSYLSFNPYGKMPLLVLEDGTAIFESQVIESYILDKYRDHGPSLIPDTPEQRARATLVARIHDLYIAPIQGCMYKDMMSVEQRHADLKNLAFHLDVLEKMIEGPFVCGESISFGDGAIFPTFVFMTYILPKYFGWKSVFTGRPKLERWWNTVTKDADAAKVISEIQKGLEAWDASERWEKKGIKEQVKDTTFDWSCGC